MRREEGGEVFSVEDKEGKEGRKRGTEPGKIPRTCVHKKVGIVFPFSLGLR